LEAAIGIEPMHKCSAEMEGGACSVESVVFINAVPSALGQNSLVSTSLWKLGDCPLLCDNN